MKKLDYFMMAVVATIAILSVAPFVVINLVISAVCDGIKYRDLMCVSVFAMTCAKMFVAAINVVRSIAETGLIRESIDGFYKEIESL